ALEAEDHDALQDADLIRGQARAVVGVHRLDHVGDELAELRRVEFRHGFGRRPQTRVAEPQDRPDRHVLSASVRGAQNPATLEYYRPLRRVVTWLRAASGRRPAHSPRTGRNAGICSHCMYHVHFGLEKRVFDDGIDQDAAVYLGARQQSVVADCSVALASSDAVVVLTGRPGTGKTTLAGTALRTTSTRLALGALSGGAIGTVDLLEWLLTEFGFARERGTRAERLQTWRQFLSEART